VVYEMFAAEHQRELEEDAARARSAAVVVVSRDGPWWGPIATLIHCSAVVLVTPHRSEELRPQMAIDDRASEDPGGLPHDHSIDLFGVRMGDRPARINNAMSLARRYRVRLHHGPN
jgi:hypothetical protein